MKPKTTGICIFFVDISVLTSNFFFFFPVDAFFSFLRTCVDLLFWYSSRQLTALGAESSVPVSFFNGALKQWVRYIFEAYSTHLKFEIFLYFLLELYVARMTVWLSKISKLLYFL